MHRHRSLGELSLYLSLLLIFTFLVVARPPIPFYALPLAPIALAAVLYEFAGGTLAALVAIAGVAALIALDANVARRATTLQEAWPILSMYVATGPVVGWLAARERERERRLVSAARRLHVVQEIAQAITSSLDLQETLRTIFAETHRLVPFTRAAILLQEGDRLRVAAFNEGLGQSPKFINHTFALKGSAVGWAIQHRRVWTGDPADVTQFEDTRQLCPPHSSCLIIPLQFQRKVIGAFVLGGEGFHNPSTADLDNLAQIAGQTAIAIEHARLFELERNRSRHLAAISEAGREIAASLDLKRTLRLVMDRAVATLPMDAGALFQFETGSDAYQVAVSHNLSPDHVAKITFAFAEGVPGWVVDHRQTLIVPDAAADERVHPYVLEEGVLSVMATPLVAREQVVGVLNLYCKTQTHAFDDEAAHLAEIFAAQAALAIENAHLVDELRQAAAELEARVERRTQQLRETQAQIVRAEKLAVVGRLAASVAHEVNNPLQAIALQLQLIAEEGLDEPASERLGIVQDELARIAGIVQRLLDFQRPTLGERTPQDVSTLLDDVLTLLGKQLQQRGISVVRDGDGNLAPALVASDQMKQVFLNLILNALEAMPDGGKLQVGAQQSNGLIVVTLTDTGVGMSSEVMNDLFEPFFSTKTSGTGLGLAVSHEIVTQHGGTIEASSQPGRGSTFTIRLPVHTQGNDH
ncbi:MAG: GAF domain-containing protein [Anaerolineae bacterium]